MMRWADKASSAALQMFGQRAWRAAVWLSRSIWQPPRASNAIAHAFPVMHALSLLNEPAALKWLLCQERVLMVGARAGALTMSSIQPPSLHLIQQIRVLPGKRMQPGEPMAAVVAKPWSRAA